MAAVAFSGEDLQYIEANFADTVKTLQQAHDSGAFKSAFGFN